MSELRSINEDSNLVLGTPLSVAGTDSKAGGAYVLNRYSPTKRLWAITPNLWAIESAKGSVSVYYSAAGRIVTRANIYAIKGDFGGYPEVFYGRKPFGLNAPYANGQSVVFPRKVWEMSRLICTVDYNLISSKMGGNIAYDLWLTNEAFPSSPSGGVEVMIWLWRRSQIPLGIYTGSVYFLVNDFPMRFSIYVGKASGWDVVSILLDDRRMIQKGTVKLNLIDFIGYGLRKLGRSGELYLQGIEFGTEFTNADQLFEFTLSKFMILST